MRRSLISAGVSGLLVLFGLIAAAPSSAAQASSVGIHVQDGDWGAATPRDIETVLVSVAEEMLQFFPEKRLSPVRVVSDAGGPRVFFDRTARGEYVVFLSVRDSRWDQFAYQFSHELCHILSNHDHKDITDHGVARDNQWFEEALCESVSLLNLRRLATSWERSSRDPRRREYAPAFREYADRLLGQRHRELPVGITLADWYRRNQASLRNDPYLRDKTELVANALLGLLERDPRNLSALAYLNEEKSATSGSFENYLTSWGSCCPPTHRTVVRQTMAMFGLSGHEAVPG